MAKEYKAGDRYYLPVCVNEIDSGYLYSVRIAFNNGDGNNEGHNAIKNEPDLLLTATEIAENIAGRRCAECYPTYEELKSRNAELEALLKEVMATRDEAVKQNNELIADCANWKEAAQRYHDSAKVADAAADNLRKENRELKAAVDKLKDTLVDRTKDVQHYKEENDNLKAWYEEANKTATEAADANDELKAKIADLRNRVGEQLAQIQDLNAEVHFLKEKGGKRTDEATKHAHVVLNDGTELAFTQKDTIAFYRDDVDMLFISDGDGVIAGFNRGDKPFNFAYFY